MDLYVVQKYTENIFNKNFSFEILFVSLSAVNLSTQHWLAKLEVLWQHKNNLSGPFIVAQCNGITFLSTLYYSRGNKKAMSPRGL